MNEWIVSITRIIPAGPCLVWKALTDPELISRYMFGTKVKSTWQTGSSIRFSGTYEGQEYMDKGTILGFESETELTYSYLSSFSGLEDVPENYSVVSFLLAPAGSGTKLTVKQENFRSPEACAHSQAGWELILNTFLEIITEL
jgi:uncharacterized protein YndB with AHSA1/START domain